MMSESSQKASLPFLGEKWLLDGFVGIVKQHQWWPMRLDPTSISPGFLPANSPSLFLSGRTFSPLSCAMSYLTYLSHPHPPHPVASHSLSAVPFFSWSTFTLSAAFSQPRKKAVMLQSLIDWLFSSNRKSMETAFQKKNTWIRYFWSDGAWQQLWTTLDLIVSSLK